MSWPLVTLASVGEISTGSTPPTVDAANYGGTVPFVTPSELGQSEPVVFTPRTLTDQGVACARIIPQDAVMVCCIGSLGKAGIAGRELATNQQINSVVFDPAKVWPRFGLRAVARLSARLAEMAPATTIPIVSKSKFSTLSIPLPPLDEQRRIAEILDQVDAVRSKRRATIRCARRLKRATFERAIARSGHPVQKLLSEVYWFQEGPGVRKWQFTDTGVKLLNVSNITKDGRLDLEATERHISNQEARGKYRHFLVDEGDFVIASSGISFDTDGLLRTRGAFVARRDLPLCMNTSTIRFKRRKDGPSLVFLQQWLASYEFRSQITRLVTGSAQQNFGPSHLKQVVISTLEPSAEALLVEEISAVQRCIARQFKHLSKLDDLYASLQERAFNGRL